MLSFLAGPGYFQRKPYKGVIVRDSQKRGGNNLRFTVILDNELYQELQRLRGERIQVEGKSLPLSSLIRELLRLGLEALKSNIK